MKAKTVKPVYRIEMLCDIPYSGGILRQGQVIRSELLAYGSNWIKVQIPQGPRKTLLNFEAKRTIAD